MNEKIQVGTLPERPLMIYDGDCGFCRRWVRRVHALTGTRVDYQPYQQVAQRFPEVPPEHFQNAVQFISTKGRVSEGARAVAETLRYSILLGIPLWIYRLMPRFSERAYAWVARNRHRL